MKIYNRADTNYRNEVEAVKAVNQNVASGTVAGKGLIVMHKAKGKSIQQIYDESKDPETEVQTLLEELWPKVTKLAADIAQNEGFYHSDLHGGNVCVHHASIWLLDSC